MPSRRAGFTLIELVVGLAIMVMLATVVTPVMLGALDSARREQASTTLANLAAAIKEFHDDVGEWPGNLSHLSEPIAPGKKNSCGHSYSAGDAGKWKGPYVDRVISGGGVPLSIGTVQNDLHRLPPVQWGMDWGVLKMVVRDVTEADATALDAEVDGETGQYEGTVLHGWPDDEGRLDVYYLIPITGC